MPAMPARPPPMPDPLTGPPPPPTGSTPAALPVKKHKAAPNNIYVQMWQTFHIPSVTYTFYNKGELEDLLITMSERRSYTRSTSMDRSHMQQFRMFM